MTSNKTHIGGGSAYRFFAIGSRRVEIRSVEGVDELSRKKQASKREDDEGGDPAIRDGEGSKTSSHMKQPNDKGRRSFRPRLSGSSRIA